MYFFAIPDSLARCNAIMDADCLPVLQRIRAMTLVKLCNDIEDPLVAPDRLLDSASLLRRNLQHSDAFDLAVVTLWMLTQNPS